MSPLHASRMSPLSPWWWSPSSSSRDQCMKMALSAIAVLVLLQYSFNIALTRKYLAWKQYSPHTGNVSRDTAAHGVGGGNVLRWLLAHHPPTPPPTLPPCPAIPPSLEGRNMSTGIIPIFFDKPSWPDLEAQEKDVLYGGEWKPSNCTAVNRIAVVIPYRDREEHLRVFLNHMHPFLQRQQLHYTIFVVEQVGPFQFSRSTLMNIGYTEALKLDDFDCFFFHDVDLLPENDFNLYRCPEQPRHMSAAVDTMGYRLPYPTIFGGVSALTTEQFKNVNGFSNLFFGWGGEDDDMYNRINEKGYKVLRYPMNVARYRMIRHAQDQPSNDRFKNLYEGSQRFSIEGLNSLLYNVTGIEKYKLFTRLQVFLNKTEIVEAHEKRMRALRLQNLKNRLYNGTASHRNLDPNTLWVGAVNSIGDVLDHKPDVRPSYPVKTAIESDTSTDSDSDGEVADRTESFKDDILESAKALQESWMESQRENSLNRGDSDHFLEDVRTNWQKLSEGVITYRDLLKREQTKREVFKVVPTTKEIFKVVPESRELLKSVPPTRELFKDVQSHSKKTLDKTKTHGVKESVRYNIVESYEKDSRAVKHFKKSDYEHQDYTIKTMPENTAFQKTTQEKKDFIQKRNKKVIKDKENRKIEMETVDIGKFEIENEIRRIEQNSRSKMRKRKSVRTRK